MESKNGLFKKNYCDLCVKEFSEFELIYTYKRVPLNRSLKWYGWIVLIYCDSCFDIAAVDEKAKAEKMTLAVEAANERIRKLKLKLMGG